MSSDVVNINSKPLVKFKYKNLLKIKLTCRSVASWIKIWCQSYFMVGMLDYWAKSTTVFLNHNRSFRKCFQLSYCLFDKYKSTV